MQKPFSSRYIVLPLAIQNYSKVFMANLCSQNSGLISHLAARLSTGGRASISRGFLKGQEEAVVGESLRASWQRFPTRSRNLSGCPLDRFCFYRKSQQDLHNGTGREGVPGQDTGCSCWFRELKYCPCFRDRVNLSVFTQLPFPPLRSCETIVVVDSPLASW